MKRVLTVCFTLALAASLTGCSSGPSALAECKSVVAAHFGVRDSDVRVGETIKNPVGAYDWQGAAGNGTWACASPDGEQLTTAIAFDAEMMPTALVVR